MAKKDRPKGSWVPHEDVIRVIVITLSWAVYLFLVLSGLERFPIEFLRRNPHWLLGLTQPQWIAMLSVVIGTVMILVTRHREPVPNTGSVKQPSG